MIGFIIYELTSKQSHEGKLEEIVTSPEEALKQMHRGESKMQNYMLLHKGPECGIV